MQIVIDIDDITYNATLERKQLAICNDNDIYEWIKNGTPLLKGHGRLIDADDLDITTITTDDYSGNEVLDIVLKEDVDSAPTIIEADKTERE